VALRLHYYVMSVLEGEWVSMHLIWLLLVNHQSHILLMVLFVFSEFVVGDRVSVHMRGNELTQFYEYLSRLISQPDLYFLGVYWGLVEFCR